MVEIKLEGAHFSQTAPRSNKRKKIAECKNFFKLLLVDSCAHAWEITLHPFLLFNY